MKVKELKEKLNQFGNEEEVIIRFALSNEDEIGYVLKPIEVTSFLEDDVVIYGNYEHTKEDCDFIGQVDLKTLWEKEMGD
ncbi:MAG: hypothetical protein RR585_10060 [Coprobacillus sp.]